MDKNEDTPIREVEIDVDGFAAAIGLGDGASMLKAMASEYWKGNGVTVEFQVPGRLPVTYSAIREPLSRARRADQIGDVMKEAG